MKLEKILHYYKTAAVFLFNIIVFFLLFNLSLLVVFTINDQFFDRQKSSPVENKYDKHLLEKVYPHLNPSSISEMLNETWSRPYVYEPYTLFKEAPYKGNYVNVSANGYRITKNQGPWPPEKNNINIFLLGGSTTFGYGLPDNNTIASYLQEFLTNKINRNIKVYNFGRGSYYSTQERILFEKLIASGFIPDIAIFIDGLNDFYTLNNEPEYSDRFEKIFLNADKEKKVESLESKLLSMLPVSRLAQVIKYKVSNLSDKEINGDSSEKQDITAQRDHNEKNIRDYKIAIDKVINIYLDNKKMIEAVANAYSVKPVFVWQPVPTYNYDLNYHLFAPSKKSGHKHSGAGYIVVRKLIEKRSLGENFYWAADIQRELKKPLYIDLVHYTAEMSEILAIKIGEFLLQKNIL